MDILDAPAATGPALSLRLLRAVLSVHLLAVACQPVLAGLFLTGDVDAIALHGTIGTLLAAVGLVAAGVAVAYVTRGRGRRWVLPAAVVLFLADGLQLGFGYARLLQVHIPLGVAIVTASVVLVIWVWSPAAAVRR